MLHYGNSIVKKVISLLSLAVVAIPADTIAKSVDDLIQETRSAYQSQNYEKVRRLANQVLDQDPNQATAYKLLGLASLKQNQIPPAIEFLQKATMITPADASLQRHLAQAHFNQGNLEPALARLKLAGVIEPNSSQVKAQYRDFAKQLKAPIENETADVPAILDLARFLVELGKLEQADTLIQAVLERDSNNARALGLSGVYYLSQGRSEKAESEIRRAIEMNPEDETVRSYLFSINSVVELAQSEYESAVKQSRRAQDLIPQNWRAVHSQIFNQRASVMRLRSIQQSSSSSQSQQSPYINQAIDLYNQAIDANPANYQAYRNLASTLLELSDRKDEALIQAKQAVELAPKKPEVYYTLGKVEKELGKYEKAIANFKEALELNPEFSQAQKQLNQTQSILEN